MSTLTVRNASVTFATLVAVSLYSLRRRVTSKWINLHKSLSALDDLTKRTVVITGATDGLGYQLAVDLVRRGCGTIVIGCRNVERGTIIAENIKAEAGLVSTTTVVKCIQLDLSSLVSVREFAQKLKLSHPKVFALVCNAGVWVPMNQKRKTVDGFEVHFGVNHLAHFLLVRLLTDNLLASGDSETRVVMVSSSLLKGGKINFVKKDFVHEGRMCEGEKQIPETRVPTGYADSKLMNYLMCQQLSRNFKDSNISTYSVCPGWCQTNLSREVKLPWYKKLMVAPIFLLFQRSSRQGSQNLVFCTIEKKANLISGALYKDGVIDYEESEHARIRQKEASENLWSLSEDLISKCT